MLLNQACYFGWRNSHEPPPPPNKSSGCERTQGWFTTRHPWKPPGRNPEPKTPLTPGLLSHRSDRASLSLFGGIILQLTGLECQETFLRLEPDHVASNNTCWSHSGVVVPTASRSWLHEDLHQALSSRTTPSHKGLAS